MHPLIKLWAKHPSKMNNQEWEFWYELYEYMDLHTVLNKS